MCHGNHHHHWSEYKSRMQKRHGRGHWGRHHGQGRSGSNYPPVNVRESGDQYELLVYAPGLSREDFKIGLKDDVLTIAAPQSGDDAGAWRRQEYRPGGFERSFVLNEKVDTTEISARYADGILYVTLPKEAGWEASQQDIIVS